MTLRQSRLRDLLCRCLPRAFGIATSSFMTGQGCQNTKHCGIVAVLPVFVDSAGISRLPRGSLARRILAVLIPNVSTFPSGNTSPTLYTHPGWECAPWRCPAQVDDGHRPYARISILGMLIHGGHGSHLKQRSLDTDASRYARRPGSGRRGDEARAADLRAKHMELYGIRMIHYGYRRAGTWPQQASYGRPSWPTSG